LFQVNADERPEGRSYYAIAAGFGCGKSCSTPERAIYHLANDNGAEVLNLCYQYEDEI